MTGLPLHKRMTQADRIAANVLWRDRVPVPVLVRLFGHSKNTLFSTAFTGGGAYRYGDKAVEINDLVEKMGVDEARRRYVTKEMARVVETYKWRFIDSEAE